MRYVAPTREAVDRAVFARPPLDGWSDFADLLQGDWPSPAMLNSRWPEQARERFAAQTPELLADGLHYERRIAELGLIATRERNWHDLFNALVWLRHPALKRALNARQVAEVARMGPKHRSRPQYALTHFDEAGVIVLLRDPQLLALWDAHDWHGLLWRERAAWADGRLRLVLFGHALLEHALTPDKLLVGKAVAVLGEDEATACARVAQAVDAGQALRDPLELRPLPLSGIPGWRADNADQAFHITTPCYRPLRQGRTYPAPLPAA